MTAVTENVTAFSLYIIVGGKSINNYRLIVFSPVLW